MEKGATSLSVVYSTSMTQATYNGCRVGGLPAESQLTTGCFDSSQGITVGNAALTASKVVHLGGRTLQGFSTGAQAKMYDCSIGCPYVDFAMYYEYYGKTFDYANQWVTAALDGTDAVKEATGADFSASAGFDPLVRVEAAKKGTAYMSVWSARACPLSAHSLAVSHDGCCAAPRWS